MNKGKRSSRKEKFKRRHLQDLAGGGGEEVDSGLRAEVSRHGLGKGW